jgi:hypothetical protein
MAMRPVTRQHRMRNMLSFTCSCFESTLRRFYAGKMSK